jgi:hypothetical protein
LQYNPKQKRISTRHVSDSQHPVKTYFKQKKGKPAAYLQQSWHHVVGSNDGLEIALDVVAALA